MLTSDPFDRLLERLGADRDRAGEKYEELRRTLIRFFEWRGAPYPDEHADETLDRVSRKLADGLAIHQIRGYCYEVARLVCLEALKTLGRRPVALESVGVPVQPSVVDATAATETRQDCLDECLRLLSGESRDLIIEYYRDENRSRIDGRRALAERLGLRRDALANRAQRVREKLEVCVNRCVQRRLRYTSTGRVTDRQG